MRDMGAVTCTMYVHMLAQSAMRNVSDSQVFAKQEPDQ